MWKKARLDSGEKTISFTLDIPEDALTVGPSVQVPGKGKAMVSSFKMDFVTDDTASAKGKTKKAGR